MKTKRAWIVAFATIFAGISLALVQNKVAPCMTTLMGAFNIDMATAGWLSSLFSLVGIIMAIPASIVLNKLGPKKGGIVALACAILGSLIGVFTDSVPVLMASRIVEGVGVGLMSVIGPSLIAMWFPEAKRGLPMSIWAAYQMGAQAVMFFLGAVLTTSFGWQGVWWFGLVACVVAFVLYVLCVKSPRPEDSYADVESEDVSIVEGIKSPSAWVLSLATMLFCIGCFGFVNWIATCWAQTFTWDEGQANMWVGYFSIFGVIAAVIIGALLNHVKNRKLFGVAALVLYGLLHIYWYDAIFQFGVLLFIILLFRELLGQAAEDMRFHMEHRISHLMQREDRMTGLPNRRAFEEYMERIRTGEVGCRDAVLTYIRLEGLNERNDRLGLQAGDEAVIAAARCVADFCRACQDGGESVSCFRTGGNEFALIRPEPRANSGQLHRQFSAIVARYNRTCAPRARITMTYGFSRLCDEDGKSRSISAWKAEADAYLKRNETRLGGDTE